MAWTGSGPQALVIHVSFFISGAAAPYMYVKICQRDRAARDDKEFSYTIPSMIPLSEVHSPNLAFHVIDLTPYRILRTYYCSIFICKRNFLSPLVPAHVLVSTLITLP